MYHFIDRHNTKIQGIISYLDRVVITGTIPNICYAEGMVGFLYANSIRIFDYTKLVKLLRNRICFNTEKQAGYNDLEIKYIRRKNFRKESRVGEIIKEHEVYPGLLHIFSALEPYTPYKPWHDQETHKTSLKHTDDKCLFD